MIAWKSIRIVKEGGDIMEISLFKNQTRFRIALTLIDKPNGVSIMQMNKILKDVA